MHLKTYFDYKSPYAFLAVDGIYELERKTGCTLEMLPYTLDIPAYLGSARTDDEGKVLESERNGHQWRRVRYSYMDCRREANRRGLTIRGTRKIFDSTIAHIGFLFMPDDETQRRYHSNIFEKFWRRELDIENTEVIAQEITEAGADGTLFESYLNSEGRKRLSKLHLEAEEAGVFGVPSYLVGDALFWGAERAERVYELLSAQ